jgi:hypothetical protein
MTAFPLEKYRHQTEQALDQFDMRGRELFLMKEAQAFFDAHTPKEPISLGRECEGSVCLERDGLLLAIYFSEKGGKNLIALFDYVVNALDYLAAKYLDIPKLPLDWVALNQAFERQRPIA